MKKSKADLVRNGLEKARRDLMTAKNGLDSSEPFTDIICFHAQQAGAHTHPSPLSRGEKGVYLVWQEIEFPKTHSLGNLLLLASQKDSSFLTLVEDASILTPYAVEIRYGSSVEPSFEDAKKVVAIAEQIRDFILAKLPSNYNL